MLISLIYILCYHMFIIIIIYIPWRSSYFYFDIRVKQIVDLIEAHPQLSFVWQTFSL